MSPSSEPVIDQLEAWADQLKALISADADTVVDPIGQLAVENAIAAGVSILAGESLPEPSVEQTGRPILARDLVITTDLVLRALRAHS